MLLVRTSYFYHVVSEMDKIMKMDKIVIVSQIWGKSSQLLTD